MDTGFTMDLRVYIGTSKRILYCAWRVYINNAMKKLCTSARALLCMREFNIIERAYVYLYYIPMLSGIEKTRKKTTIIKNKTTAKEKDIYLNTYPYVMRSMGGPFLCGPDSMETERISW